MVLKSPAVADFLSSVPFSNSRIRFFFKDLGSKDNIVSRTSVLSTSSSIIESNVLSRGATPFKEALANWTLQTSTYENSPFYNVEYDNKGKTKDAGFAYYTYGKDHSINSFIYVSPTAVYETRDEGKTWYNITPKAK